MLYQMACGVFIQCLQHQALHCLQVFPSFSLRFCYGLLIICIFYIFVSSFDISLLSFATFVFFFMFSHQLCSLECSIWLIIHLTLLIFHKHLSHDFIKFLYSKTVKHFFNLFFLKDN